MAGYRLTRLADEDLVGIASYTLEQWGEAQRDRYIRELFHQFDWIAQHPASCRRVDFVRPGLRKHLHPSGRHAIYFRMGSDGVSEILRILHTSQDRKRALE